MLRATISLDDGGEHDAEVLEVLEKQGVPATCYLVSALLVESIYLGRSVEEIKALYKNHEVGCHGRHHLWLHKNKPGVWQDEVVRARKELQAFFGQSVSNFAYPYNAVPERGLGFEVFLQKMGFDYARRYTEQPGEVPNVQGRWDIPISCRMVGMFPDVIMKLADKQLPIHLSGHSWEISKNYQVKTVGQVVGFMKGRGYEFAVNSKFFRETVRA